jgi:hypothetical protein
VRFRLRKYLPLFLVAITASIWLYTNFRSVPDCSSFRPIDFEKLTVDGLSLRMTRAAVLRRLGNPAKKQTEPVPWADYKQESWTWVNTSIGFRPEGGAMVVSRIYGACLSKGDHKVLSFGEKASEVRQRLQTLRWEVEFGQHLVCSFPSIGQTQDENYQLITNGGRNRIHIFYENGLVKSVSLQDALLEAYF